jgi:ABC-type Fe3+-hydroxamate transport system substrate-binding protein
VKWVALSITILLAGCGDREVLPPADGQRIVSLSPAITRTLVDLGLHDDLVGRSAFCRSVDQNIPVVGDLDGIDYERLVRLCPTHVLVQDTAAWPPQPLLDMASKGDFTLQAWPLDRLEDIDRVLRELPCVLDADGAYAEELRAALRSPLASADGRSAMLLTDGQLAFGRGTWIDDLWKEMGGLNVLNAEGWVQLSNEDLARRSAELFIVLSDQGLSLKEQMMYRTLPSVRKGESRFVPIVLEDAMLPSTGVVEVRAALAHALSQVP